MIRFSIIGFKKNDPDPPRWGDCTIINDSSNYLVIDGYCQIGTTRLIRRLKDLGVKNPVLFISHAHYDHYYGIRKIINDAYFAPKALYMYDPDSLGDVSGDVRSEKSTMKAIRNEAQKRGIPVKYLKNGDHLEFGEIKFDVYRVQPSYHGNSDAYINDGSLVFYFPDLRYLTSGDGSEYIGQLCKDNGLKPLCIKIPHHGNNCDRSQSKILWNLGCRYCWDNDISPNYTQFLQTGREDCISVGMKYFNCIGDLDFIFSGGKAIIIKDGKRIIYDVPFKGSFQTGWNKQNGHWYWQNEDGTVAAGWIKAEWTGGVNWFYFNALGEMQTGWIKTNGWWYYLDPDTGAMRTGWLDWNGKKCYLEPDENKNEGHAYCNETAIIDGETWHFDSDCYGTKMNGVDQMNMNGIDISNHQSGMDLAKVLDQTNTDFVIVKASEGLTFVDKYCDKFYQIAKKKGVGLGFYHFARPELNSAAKEADFFCRNTEGYFGQAIPVLDWESSGKKNVAWAKEWLDLVYKKTGVKPVIYMSESVVNAYNWKAVADAGYGLWVAKYRDYNADRNYDMSTAGKKPVVKWWSFYMMWQWTSAGRLTGYSGNLDCDVFYGNRDQWNAYVKSAQISTGGVEVDKIYGYVSLCANLPLLRIGAKCNAVKLVQMVIGANVDGDFGTNTEAKLIEFEKKYGLVQDGLVDEADWKVIMDWLATV